MADRLTFGGEVPDSPAGEVPGAGTDCPRCGQPDEKSRFYGPCEACREELGATMRLVPRDVEVQAYTPKMNVVPNHVATKE